MRIQSSLPKLLAGLVLSGCSFLVDSGPNGHPCGPPPDYACLSGYACSNPGNICVPASQATCPSGCPSGTECIHQVCVGICNGLECPPGTMCGSGSCVAVAAGSGAGAPCQTDTDCASSAANLFCLQQYTGGPPQTGVCTTTCTKANADAGAADSCASLGLACTTFPSDTPVDSVPGIPSGIDICAPAGLTPCPDVPGTTPCGVSQLTCGVLAAKTSSGYASVSACVTPVSTDAGPGATCTVSSTGAEPQQCASGLCVINNISSTGAASRFCSLPCTENSDCTTAFNSASTGVVTTCELLTIVEQDGTPRTRANLCVLGMTKSLGASCHPDTPSCGPDAPKCVPAIVAPPDAGVIDAGPVDAGPVDAGPLDAGPVDAGADAGDAGPADAGETDSGMDAGAETDAGMDAGELDGGMDAGPGGGASPGGGTGSDGGTGDSDAGVSFICAPFCSQGTPSCPPNPNGVALQCDTLTDSFGGFCE